MEISQDQDPFTGLVHQDTLHGSILETIRQCDETAEGALVLYAITGDDRQRRAWLTRKQARRILIEVLNYAEQLGTPIR